MGYLYVCDGTEVDRSKSRIVLGFASEYTKDSRSFLRNREPIVLIRAHVISSEQGSRPTPVPMIEGPLDDHRLFDTGNDLRCPTTVPAGPCIDYKVHFTKSRR